MEEKKTPEMTAEVESGGWIEALCVNTRFGSEKLKRGTFVKLTPEREKLMKKAGRQNFRLHKTLSPELKKRLKADGKLVE